MWRDGVVEAMLEPRQLAEHRVAADVQPRVVDGAQPVLDLVAGGGGALAVAGRDRGARRRTARSRPGPTGRSSPRRALAAVGQLQRLLPLAVVRDDVGEVVVAARLQVGVARPARRRSSMCCARELEVAGRRLDPGREQQRASPARSAGAASPAAASAAEEPLRRRGCRRARSTPSRTRWRCAARAAGRARRSRPARRRCSRARRARRRGARPGGAAHAGGRRAGRGGVPRGVRGERALGQPGLGHRLEREGADAVEQPVARRPRSTITSERLGEPADHVDRRRRGHVERLEHRLDRGAAARRRRTWPAPTARAGRRGTAARSSSRSSPAARGGARACGWSGRSAR